MEILAFPSNEFGRQEPKSNEEIQKFVADRGVKFPVFAKTLVNGKNAHPVFNFLRAKLSGTLGSYIKWNFTKFLCDRDGLPVKRFSPSTKPNECEDDIVKLLNKAATKNANAPTSDGAEASSSAPAAAASSSAHADKPTEEEEIAPKSPKSPKSPKKHKKREVHEEDDEAKDASSAPATASSSAAPEASSAAPDASSAPSSDLADKKADEIVEKPVEAEPHTEPSPPIESASVAPIDAAQPAIVETVNEPVSPIVETVNEPASPIINDTPSTNEGDKPVIEPVDTSIAAQPPSANSSAPPSPPSSPSHSPRLSEEQIVGPPRDSEDLALQEEPVGKD